MIVGPDRKKIGENLHQIGRAFEWAKKIGEK